MRTENPEKTGKKRTQKLIPVFFPSQFTLLAGAMNKPIVEILSSEIAKRKQKEQSDSLNANIIMKS